MLAEIRASPLEGDYKMSQGLRITFLMHVVVALGFGIVMYLVPETWATLVNWVPFDSAITRLYGAALLALAVGSWFGYRATRWHEVRIVVQMGIALAVLSTLGGLYELLLAGAPAFTSVAIVIFVVFAVAWIYFYREAQP